MVSCHFMVCFYRKVATQIHAMTTVGFVLVLEGGKSNVYKEQHDNLRVKMTSVNSERHEYTIQYLDVLYIVASSANRDDLF